MYDWFAIAILGWVVIGADWLNQKEGVQTTTPTGPSSSWEDDWSVESSYGTLSNDNQVVVLRRDKVSTLGSAADNQTTTTTYYSAALLKPDNTKSGFPVFGGVSNLAIWPASNPQKVLADDAAEAYWEKTGGSGNEGPAGPVGPQGPTPEGPGRPSLPQNGFNDPFSGGGLL